MPGGKKSNYLEIHCQALVFTSQDLVLFFGGFFKDESLVLGI